MIIYLLTNPRLALPCAEDWSLDGSQRAKSIVFNLGVCSNRKFGPGFQKSEPLLPMKLLQRAEAKDWSSIL